MKGRTTVPEPTLSQLIQTCAADDLRAFLLGAMEEDDRLARKFRQRFEPHDGPDAAADLLRDVDELCAAYPVFISWRAGGSFENEYFDLVESYLAPARKTRDLDRLLVPCTTRWCPRYSRSIPGARPCARCSRASSALPSEASR